MKTKLFNCVATARNKMRRICPYVLSFAIMSMIICSNVAFAATDGQALLTMICKVLGGLALASGVITAIIGLVAYAEAKAEGEGPEMKKAKSQITAGILLIVVGATLTAGASTIGALIDKSISI